MVILDTDHLTLLFKQTGDAATNIARRLSAASEPAVTTTIVTYEEQTRGWLSYIAGARTMSAQVESYRRLERHLQQFLQVEILGLTEAAAVEFQRLRKLPVRIGTLDLRIAAIALTHDATVLTRNLRDFQKVPGLKVEDWST